MLLFVNKKNVTETKSAIIKNCQMIYLLYRACIIFLNTKLKQDQLKKNDTCCVFIYNIIYQAFMVELRYWTEWVISKQMQFLFPSRNLIFFYIIRTYGKRWKVESHFFAGTCNWGHLFINCLPMNDSFIFNHFSGRQIF